jgi:general nucleoside transport system permease protein
MYESSFGTPLGIANTLLATTPLILTAAATSIIYRLGVYSIGQDGQLLLGATFASGVLLLIPGAPSFVLIAAAAIAGCIGGALWAAIPAYWRARWRTNEVLSTLMMNFIAIYMVSYLVIGRVTIWRDKTDLATAQAAMVTGKSNLPTFYQSADIGIFLAVAVALLLSLMVARTKLGYEMRVMGSSESSAAYGGISPRRLIVIVFCLSGAVCGLAGAIQVMSVTHALDPLGIDPGVGLGYTGIVVAALARFNLIAIIPTSLLVGALLGAGPALQLIGVPSALVVVLQGLILFIAAGGQFFLSYRIRAIRPSRAEIAE